MIDDLTYYLDENTKAKTYRGRYLLYLEKKLGRSKSVILETERSSLEIIKQSLPYAALILLMLLYNRSDAVILERIHVNGRIEAGFYAQGFRLLDALYMFGMIFAGLLFQTRNPRVAPAVTVEKAAIRY